MRKPGFHFIFFILILFSLPARADHVIGGEITYTLLRQENNSYTYRITLSLLRDCRTLILFEQEETLHFLNTLDLPNSTQGIQYFTRNVPLLRRGQLSPSTLTGCPINRPPTCTELFVYSDEITLPFSAEGYTIYYMQCCRSKPLSNINTTLAERGAEDHNGLPVPGTGFSFLATIPPHSAQLNSSAVASEDSTWLLCAGEPFQIPYTFSDPDNDELEITFCDPLDFQSTADSRFNRLPYIGSYSADNPFGNGVRYDPSRARFEGTAPGPGAYLISFCVREKRNGNVINTTRKELMVRVFTCDLIPPPPIVQCEGLRVGPANDNDPVNSYLWDFGESDNAGDTSQRIYPTYLYRQEGTYTIKMVITTPEGCKDSASLTARVTEGLKPDFTWTGTVCDDPFIQLQDQSQSLGGQITGWNWRIVNTGQTLQPIPNPSFQFNRPQGQSVPVSVTLTVVDSEGCSAALTKVIQLSSTPVADAGRDTIISLGSSYQLQGSGGQRYLWTPATGLNNPTLPNPIVTANQDVTYILRVENPGPCYDYDTVSIRYYKGPDVYVPNIFTPNGDGLNDLLRVTPVDVQFVSFRIYSRYGQLLYEARDWRQGWDGRSRNREMPSGVYVWTLEAIRADQSRISKKGFLTLMR